MNSVLKTENLCKSYQLGDQEIPVLSDINIDVRRGDFTAIMGPSGSGKSTLLNILGCLDLPSTGQYFLNGASVAGMGEQQLADIRNREIGFVFQNFNLLPRLDLSANVELPLIYANWPKPKRLAAVEEILKKLGIWERRRHRPNEISGGQKQRVAIARALVKGPSLILADEPTGNLDSATTAEIMALLAELHREGNTLLLITHEDSVAKYAQNTLHLRDGKIV